MDLATFIIPISFYTFIICVTPGPNNNYLLSAGSLFEYKKYIAYIIGALIASVCVFVAVGFGLGHIFETYKSIDILFKVIGSVTIMYIAYNVYKNSQVDLSKKNKEIKALGFFTAFLLNICNIKIWVCATAGIATYIPHDNLYFKKLLVFILISLIISVFTLHLWALGGFLLKRFKPSTVSIINKFFAFTLLGTIAFIYI